MTTPAMTEKFARRVANVHPDVRFMRRLNRQHKWSTSNECVRRLRDALTSDREESPDE